MNADFTRRINDWLQSVAEGCHRIATDLAYDMDLDFYVFQSDVCFRPEVMFVGANPGGGKRYSEMLAENGWTRRPVESLKSDRNMFLACDGWGSMKSLCELFSGDTLGPVFKQAVMTNVLYFNTGTFSVVRQRMNKGGREALEFCVEKNVELIRDIVQPKRIVLMGNAAVDSLKKYFDRPLEPILVTPVEGWNLIRTTTISGIPVYWIHHPSLNRKFNSGANLNLKKEKFEEIFKH